MSNQTRILGFLKALTAIPSPTGMTRGAENYVLAELTRMGYQPQHARKGTVLCRLGGNGHPLLLTAHLDTLGAVVRAVKPNGALRYTIIGGFNGNAIENENVLIHTRLGKTYTGTVQSVHASRHVWGDITEEKRDDTTLEVVVDEITASRDETLALGISSGDFISFDPRTVVTDSGFIKSRHLDDKAAAAMLLNLAAEVAEGSLTLAREVIIAFTVYEEIGHGASALCSVACDDMIAVDMGCVGDDLSCRETQVSICAKDAAGPYDYDLTTELVLRARDRGIDYAVDIYPRYSSDTATALKGGLDARFACVGQGTYASHAYERTHIRGIMQTMALIEDTASRLWK